MTNTHYWWYDTTSAPNGYVWTTPTNTATTTWTFDQAAFARAPDPQAMGRIRKVVSSAHKWGGDGRKPSFRKIRRVLLKKHPEVIAKAFGGNANVAAAWIKNNWYRMRGQEPPPTRGKKKMEAAISLDREYLEVPLEFMGEDAAELFCDNAGAEKADNLIWVTALRTGEWKVNPIPGSKGPMKIDKQWMEDVLQAWKDKAWEFVTVPSYHTDTDPLANTGFVRDLKIVSGKKRGEHLLRAAVEFTDDDAAEKVLNGSVAGVSVNVKFNVTHQETGKFYKKVLTHLALTNIPFINGLNAFSEKLAADNESPLEGITLSYQLEDDLKEDFSAFTAELIALAKNLAYDEELDYTYIRQQIEAKLTGFYLDSEGDLVDPRESDPAEVISPAHIWVRGMTQNQVLVCACSASAAEEAVGYVHVGDSNGLIHGWVLGYEVSADNEVDVDPLDEWVYVEKQWVAVDAASMDNVPITESEELEINGVVFTMIHNESELLKGGDDMQNEPEKKEQEVVVVTPEVVSMSREEIDALVATQTEAALSVYRDEQKLIAQAQEDELSLMRKTLHEKTVKESVAALVAAGHAPAVVATAKEIMLADERNEPVLSLSRDDAEVKLSATDIVTELLASIPETALSALEVVVPDASKSPEDMKSRVDSLYEELYNNDTPAVVLNS